jgi:hypothetical protein
VGGEERVDEVGLLDAARHVDAVALRQRLELADAERRDARSDRAAGVSSSTSTSTSSMWAASLSTGTSSLSFFAA